MKIQQNLSDSCQRDHPGVMAKSRAAGKMNSRGVALVVTLLLLFLMSVLGLAAVLSSSSDLLINGYYSNYRASFYAADSGLNITRQAMYTNLLAAFPTTYSGTPLSSPSGTATTVLNTINTAYGSSSSPYSLSGNATSSTEGGALSSLKESFYVKNLTFGYLSGPTPETGGVNYTYSYSITSVGIATGSEQAQISESGSFTVNFMSAAGTPGNFSFSAFGAFINNFPACNGPLVYGTLTGPMYAQGEWNFGSGGTYNFTDPVNQTGAQFSYWPGGSCSQSASVPFTSGRTTINPNFAAGYNLNQPVAQLPANSYSQEWAVLDGRGCGEGSSVCGSITNTPAQPATQDFVNAHMQNVAQQPYASGSPTLVPATSGVFLPYQCVSGTCSLNSNAGGLYVEGSNPNVSTNVTLSTTNGTGGASNPSGQVIQVAQTGSTSSSSGPVTQTGSTSCTTRTSGSPPHQTTTYTCTANYQQITAANTPTTITNVTIDQVALTTTVSSYVSTSTATTTATTSASCSGSSPCTPTAPGSISGGTEADSSSNGATTTLNLAGVPVNVNNSPATPSTMIYVDGNVNVTGPSSGAAIQNNSMVTLTANGNIQQTGNLLYATEPVTTSANQSVPGSSPACCNGDPVDTLIPQYQNMNQVLGLFTANGQFQLNPSSNGANIETDGSVASISSNSSCTPANGCGSIATPGNSVGTWTNVGGRVENSINGVNINTGNVFYDRRFTARTSFAPPWFPQTSIAAGDITGGNAANTYITPSRTQWVSNTGGQ